MIGFRVFACVFVTTLFVIFSALEIGIFYDKVSTIKDDQVKHNADRDKKIHDFEIQLKALNDGLQTGNESFKKDLKANFESFSNGYDLLVKADNCSTKKYWKIYKKAGIAYNAKNSGTVPKI